MQPTTYTSPHLGTCQTCRSLVEALTLESTALEHALVAWPAPRRRRTAVRPAAGVTLLAAVAAFGCAWLIARGWALAVAGLPGWLDPTSAEGALNLLFNSLAVLGRMGGALMTKLDSWSLTMATATIQLNDASAFI